MNDKHHDHGPAFDPQRWQAQERAFQAARRGDAEADADDLRILDALRNAPPAGLPPGFATQVAAMARAQAANSQLEQRLLRGLVLAFALSAAVVVAWQGRGWVAELAALLPGGGDALGWCAAAALCLLANWGAGLLRRPARAIAARMNAIG